jgi:hypothetical protein
VCETGCDCRVVAPLIAPVKLLHLRLSGPVRGCRWRNSSAPSRIWLQQAGRPARVPSADICPAVTGRPRLAVSTRASLAPPCLTAATRQSPAHPAGGSHPHAPADPALASAPTWVNATGRSGIVLTSRAALPRPSSLQNESSWWPRLHCWLLKVGPSGGKGFVSLEHTPTLASAPTVTVLQTERLRRPSAPYERPGVPASSTTASAGAPATLRRKSSSCNPSAPLGACPR